MSSNHRNLPPKDHNEERWEPTHTILTEEQWQAVAERLRIPPQQLAFAKEVFNGATEARAAFVLGIEKDTIHGYAKRLYKRLGVSDQRELVLRIWSAVEELS